MGFVAQRVLGLGNGGCVYSLLLISKTITMITISQGTVDAIIGIFITLVMLYVVLAYATYKLYKHSSKPTQEKPNLYNAVLERHYKEQTAYAAYLAEILDASHLVHMDFTQWMENEEKVRYNKLFDGIDRRITHDGGFQA